MVFAGMALNKAPLPFILAWPNALRTASRILQTQNIGSDSHLLNDSCTPKKVLLKSKKSEAMGDASRKTRWFAYIKFRLATFSHTRNLENPPQDMLNIQFSVILHWNQANKSFTSPENKIPWKLKPFAHKQSFHFLFGQAIRPECTSGRSTDHDSGIRTGAQGAKCTGEKGQGAVWQHTILRNKVPPISSAVMTIWSQIPAISWQRSTRNA